MSGQSRWRRAVLVHPPESLRHPDNRSVLCLEFLQVALSALDNENRLSEVRRIDDRELSAGWCGHENENERSDECASHHWGLLLPLETEAPSRA
jgi:hypothetical protein